MLPWRTTEARRVTIWYAYADGTEATDTYDLSSTQAEKGGPTLTISREWATGAEAPHTCIPIDDQADRTYLLERLEAAVFQAPEEELAYASGNLRLFITDGDIQLVYHVFPDGTLTRQREDDSLEAAYGAVDYLRLSAITYKYASIPSDVGPYPYEDLLVSIQLERRQESMIPEKLADQWEDIFPTPPGRALSALHTGRGLPRGPGPGAGPAPVPHPVQRSGYGKDGSAGLRRGGLGLDAGGGMSPSDGVSGYHGDPL